MYVARRQPEAVIVQDLYVVRVRSNKWTSPKISPSCHHVLQPPKSNTPFYNFSMAICVVLNSEMGMIRFILRDESWSRCCSFSFFFPLLAASSLFIHSWLWRLQSIWFPGFPSEVCAVSYRKHFCPCNTSLENISDFLWVFMWVSGSTLTVLAGLDSGWASAGGGHSESGTSVSVLQVSVFSKHRSAWSVCWSTDKCLFKKIIFFLKKQRILAGTWAVYGL